MRSLFSRRCSRNKARAWRSSSARLKKAEQALLDKNQFLTTASHDLRQPVHAMGFLIEAIIHKTATTA